MTSQMIATMVEKTVAEMIAKLTAKMIAQMAAKTARTVSDGNRRMAMMISLGVAEEDVTSD